MNLKQHNNIVQKLIQQIQLKDKQLIQLNKQLTQQSKTLINNQSNKTTQSTQTQKLIQKKIAQLNKQHQSKIATLNQQIKTLTQQNLQLKQRLNLKTQLQTKQKQRIAQILKKNVVDRKPGSKEDYKISALIGHYQSQINKKNTFIQTLKRQIKSMSINVNKDGSQQFNIKNKFDNKQSPSTSTSVKQQQQQQPSASDEQQTIIQNSNNNKNKKSISITEHTKTIDKFNKQIQGLNNILKNKTTQLKQLKNNYNQLTKEYYRIVNQYGVAKDFNSNNNNTQKVNRNVNNINFNPNNNNINIKSNLIQTTPSFNKTKQPSSQITLNQRDNNHFISDTNLSFDLSEDLTNLNINQDNNNNNNDISVSLTFEQNFKKFNNRPRIDLLVQQKQQQESFGHNQNQQLQSYKKKRDKNKQSAILKYNNNNSNNKHLQQLQQLITSILQILNLTDNQQILPYLNNLTIKTTFIQTNQQIINNLHEFFYKFGMGKVSKNQMIEVLDRFQDKCNKWIESNDLLDQICIQIGAKRHKLIQKINSFKQIEQQYLTKMRTASFLTQLNKSEKLLQFINFFQLDQSNLQLPQQLKNIYQQLKYVDRFVKLANTTLGIEIKDRKGLQSTLELILKKLQKYYSWEVQIEKQNQRKLNKKREKQREKLKQTAQY